MPATLPPLPYAENALEPYYSAETIRFHYGKHHQAYVDNLHRLLGSTDIEEMPLEELIVHTVNVPVYAAIFNNAAQIWNHTFFWNSMKPGGGGSPPPVVAERLVASFGSVEAFAAQFKQAAVGRFGSGWAWLVHDGDALQIVATPNAETPLATGQTPLLTVDVWEHAYYLDYQNRRPDYVQAFLDHLVNWDLVASKLSG